MIDNRILTWDGCTNVRDLGGLKTSDGRVTCRGVVVRSDHPAKLTPAGWSALYAYGIRTIVSLRTFGQEDEDIPNDAPRPSDVAIVHVDIEDITDKEFLERWAKSGLWCTPLYYQDALTRWPERHAAAVAAVANTQPGGVLIHCARGVDRTGIITLLLLSLVGVAVEDIIADYELSVDPEREEFLEREKTTTPDVLRAVLSSLDIEAYLRDGGLSQSDLDAVRARLLEPSGAERKM